MRIQKQILTFLTRMSRQFSGERIIFSTNGARKLDIQMQKNEVGPLPRKIQNTKINVRGASRWRKSKTWRSSSSPQIHQKYIYTWNNSYRTPTERWQKTSDLPKGKKLPSYLGRAKEKSKNRDKRIGTGPAPVGGSREGGKVSTH